MSDPIETSLVIDGGFIDIRQAPSVKLMDTDGILKDHAVIAKASLVINHIVALCPYQDFTKIILTSQDEIMVLTPVENVKQMLKGKL